MSLKTIINGIDVDRQRAAHPAGVVPDRSDTIAATEWLGGTQTRTMVTIADGSGLPQEFAVDADYPQALLGSGRAPSPRDLFIASVSSSFVTSFVLAAAAANVRIESMRVRAAVRVPFDASGARAEEGLPAALELRAAVDADTSRAHL